MLRVEGLTKRFGGLVAVNDVSFIVPQGQVMSIVGPNGAGKTTLFNLITGVLPPDHGEVFLGDRRITGWPPHRLAAHGIGRTFQNIRLFRHLNALENVMVGRTARTRSGVLAVLAWVGVGANRFRMPDELPYGDQRRVEIARALALEPRLLILDEPTAGMVAQEAHEVVDLMGRLSEAGVTLLLIEHNMNVVMSASDRVVVINFGEKIAEGTPAEIRADPKATETYLESS